MQPSWDRMQAGVHRTGMIVTRMLGVLAVAAWALGASSAHAAPEDRFLLIDRERGAIMVTSVVLEERELHFRDEHGAQRSRQTADLVGLLRIDAGVRHRAAGLLVMDDGQRMPGSLTGRTPSNPDAFVWMHPWLGQVEASTDQVRQLVLDPSVPAPPDDGAMRDLLVLRNGDRFEGFLASVGDPFVIEVETASGPRTLEIPMERVAAARLVTPARAPQGERGWFRDGTVMDVRERRMGDDGYARIGTSWVSGGRVLQISAGEIAGVLFDPSAMVPLASLSPVSVSSSAPRFDVPAPQVLDPDAPLGSGPIELRGPVTVSYHLEERVRRLVAEAILPERARLWGDPILVVRNDGREVLRLSIDRTTPRHLIDLPLTGRMLEFELIEGESGPVHNVLRLERAFLILGGS